MMVIIQVTYLRIIYMMIIWIIYNIYVINVCKKYQTFML